MLALVRTGRGAYAHGLFVATTLLSVVLTPLAVEVIDVLYGADVHVNPLTVTEVAVGELLLPLGTGLLIGRYLPAARRWIPAIQQVSSRLFLLCLVGFMILGWSRIASIILLGSMTGEPLAPIGVLLAVVVNEVAVVPYRWWRKRLQRREPAAPAPASVHRGVERRQAGGAEAAAKRLLVFVPSGGSHDDPAEPHPERKQPAIAKDGARTHIATFTARAGRRRTHACLADQ
jgi:hypothetical protein